MGRKNGTYIFTPEGIEDDTESIKGTIEGEKLNVAMKSDSADMEMTFKNQGIRSKILGEWDLQMSQEETLEMGTFMCFEYYIVSGDKIYGSFVGKNFGEGTFSVGEIKDGDKPKVKSIKPLRENTNAIMLTEYDGYIYGILNAEEIIKIKSRDTKIETIRK